LGNSHDTWLQGLGIDIDKLRGAKDNDPPPTFNPSLDAGDPALRSALVDTAVEFGKGFVKGVGDTAGATVNSPGGQFVSGQIDPMGTLLRRGIDAAITGDPSKMAPPSPFDNFKSVDPNDAKQQQKAKADVESLKDLGLSLLGQGDPLALAKAAPAVADVLVNGDPNQVGQGAGKVFVVGVGVAAGGVAGLGEAGVAEAGTVEAGGAEAATAEAGAARPPISPLAGEVPTPQNFGGAPTQPVPQAPGISPLAGEVAPPQSFSGAPTQAVPQVPAPAPISSLDPAFGDVPTPPQAPGPISSLDPALGTPESVAPESAQPETVRDSPTERAPDLDPPPSSVQPEAPTVPAGPPSVDPTDPIIPQAPRLPSFGPGNPEPIDPTAPTERAPVPEQVADD
jgi:hypothetical protein